MSKPITRVEVELPFWGFYESIHDSILDDAIRDHFTDDHGDVPDHIEEAIWDTDIDWDAIRREYCEHFVYQMASELSMAGKFSVDLEFSDLTSPRFYNFETDRLFATIPADQLAFIREKVEGYEGDLWRNRVKERFTSYDGFSSNYHSDITGEDWTRDDWDACQYGVMFELYLEEEAGENWQLNLTYDINPYEFTSVDKAVAKVQTELNKPIMEDK